MPTQNNRSLYSDLVNHYNGRRDKAALCRRWGSGWGLGMDGEDVILGGSEWQSPGTNRGKHKRTIISTPMVRVTPDSVVTFIKHSHGATAAPWAPYRYHAHLLMDVIGAWKGSVKSLASDVLHAGPAMTVRIAGKVIGLDEHFSYQGWRYVDGKHHPGHVKASTPVTRRTTDRKKAAHAYRLSKEIAGIAAMAERFKDRKDERGWEVTADMRAALPVRVKELHMAAGDTFDLRCEDHTERVSQLADMIAAIAYYNLDFRCRNERQPVMFERIAAYGRNKLLHEMKKLEGYVIDGAE